MPLAVARARMHLARSPRASSRLARESAALNAACARCSARFTEPGVGWRSICAPIDWGAIGPAPGLFADWRTACSNCAIWVPQGPACADATLKAKAVLMTTNAANRWFMFILRRSRRAASIGDVERVPLQLVQCAGLDPRAHPSARKMDPRVEPAGDEWINFIETRSRCPWGRPG